MVKKKKDPTWRKLKKQKPQQINIHDKKYKSRLLFFAAAIMRGNDRRNR